jgi:nucleoid-associated protein YgaU
VGLLAVTRWEWRAVTAPAPATLDEVLGLAASAAACALALWWGLGTLAAVGSHLPGRAGGCCRHVTARVAPALSRRAAAALVGVAVGGALVPGAALAATQPAATHAATAARGGAAKAVGGDAISSSAHAGPGWTPIAPPGRATATAGGPRAGATPSPSPAPAVGAEAPGWTPTRPLQRPQASAEVLGLRPRAGSAADAVVVHRGDTLWSIVARRLGPDASDAEVAAAWPAWHEANRSVIGDDPDLLVPGQQLRAPAHAASAR